ncbi:hypothetical protein OB69_03760 [Roseivirga seohaensis subsp. aquiponti]|uniref:RNA-binding protein n=1 Tax=Roseivirga seohaensis subsp. aquiponti TaxID=1566026 RepID=A0A0L8AP57_9BACT|nr:hypothetical protein OB69_03760 [Roseivirga seohaensis subsp. aquiponti]
MIVNKRPYPNNRKGQPESIGDAVKEMLKSFNIEQKFHETNLINSWEQVMGVAIAKRTSKIYIKDKKLYVHLTSAPLRHELNMSKNKILVLLAKEFGSPIVNDVVLL